MAAGASFQWNGVAFSAQVRAECCRRLNRGAEFLRSTVAQRISQPTRLLGPSLPHSVPHSDSGRLRNSLVADRADPRTLEVRVGILASTEYAPALEFGREDGSMVERSFLQRTLADSAVQESLRRILVDGR